MKRISVRFYFHWFYRSVSRDIVQFRTLISTGFNPVICIHEYTIDASKLTVWALATRR